MPPLRALDLPTHLSYKSCIVLIPPAAIQVPIQKIREAHDRGCKRWMPHINIMYPFLAKPSSSLPLIRERVVRALNAARISGPLNLCLSSVSHFNHSKGSTTVWLRPQNQLSSVNTPTAWDEFAASLKGEEFDKNSQLLLHLRAALLAEFVECDVDKQSYEPHLSVGQAKGTAATTQLEEVVRETMLRFCLDADERTRNEAVQGGADADFGILRGTWSLPWSVDRLFIAERKGFRDPFRIVDEISLN